MARDGSVADAGQCRRRSRSSAVGSLMPGSWRPRAGAPARSRPSRPATTASARRTAAGSGPGRPSAADARRPGPGRGGDVHDLDVELRAADDVARPLGPRREQPVDEVMDAGGRVLGQQLDDGLGDVRRVGRGPPLVRHDAERFAGGLGSLRGVEDPARVVAARRPEQPRRPGDPEAPRPGVPDLASNASGREPLALGLRRAVRICRARPGRSAGTARRRAGRRRRPRWSRSSAGPRRARRRPRPAPRSRPRSVAARAPDRARSRRRRSRPRHGRRPRVGRGRAASRSPRVRRGRTRRVARRSARSRR